MPDTANEKVVSLDDYGQMRRGLGNGPGTQALREVRELASTRLKQQVGRMMEKVDDALFARAEKAENNMAQTTYFDAMREMRIIREDIEEDFIAGFNVRFNQGVPRKKGSDQSLSLSFEDDASIGLVGKDDMEEDLAVANMVTKTRGTCTQSLYSLDKRIGFLIRDPDLEQWQNPLGPEAICDAFREAAGRIETGLEIRLVIFKLFDQHVICHLDELYKEINQSLVRMGVLPEIRATLRKSALPPGTHPGTPPAAGSQADPTGPPAGYGEAPAGYVMSGPALGLGGPPAGAAGDPPVATYAAGAHANPAVGGIHSSLAALTFLQHGGAGGSPQEQAEHFGLDSSVIASGQVNILHGIKGSPLAQELGKAGDMTIDIVAMLFDYILDEPSIPDAMRALIGRLQIPVLKVALMEREFFTRKSHPARQLLNRLAANAVSWDESLGSDDPLYRKIESTVQTIVDKFEDDTRLFVTLLEELDRFLAQEEERAQVRTERSVRVMQGRERLAVAEATTREEIEPRVGEQVSLDFIRAFVTGHWKNLLFLICTREGKDSAAWRQAVATMDDLIWSVKPKHSLEERQKLIAMQPALLDALRQGMERLSVPGNERDDFIAQLVRAHGRTTAKTPPQEQAPAPAQAPPTAPTPPAASPTAEAVAPVVPTLSASQEIRPPATDTPPAAEDACSKKVQALRTGDWLEVINDDGSIMRAKLSWKSPITGTYLLTDRQGLKAGNYTHEELAGLLRRARVRLLNRAPLMDRAVGQALKEYQKR